MCFRVAAHAHVYCVHALRIGYARVEFRHPVEVYDSVECCWSSAVGQHHHHGTIVGILFGGCL